MADFSSLFGRFGLVGRATRHLVAIEVWDASTRLPADLLEALPVPGQTRRVAARFTGFPPLREDGDITPVRARPID